MSIDMVRLLFGPLNEHLCELNAILKNTIQLTFIIMSTSLIIWKFMFLVVWNGIPIMDDAFLTRVSILCSISIREHSNTTWSVKEFKNWPKIGLKMVRKWSNSGQKRSKQWSKMAQNGQKMIRNSHRKRYDKNMPHGELQ